MSVLHSFEFPPEKKQQTTTQQPVTTQAETPQCNSEQCKKDNPKALFEHFFMGVRVILC